MRIADLLAGSPVLDDQIVAGHTRLSTVELRSWAARCAGGLHDHGIARGDRVAFQLPVCPEALVVYRACWHAGFVPVAVHPLAGRQQVAQVLARSRPATFIDSIDLPVGSAIEPAPADPADDGLIMFTSGSTGEPKGVVHTQAGLVYKVNQLIGVHALTSDDVVLMPAPLAHVSGLLHGTLIPGALGAKTVLMERWDAGTALDLIEREQVTWMVGPPTFFLGLMDHPSFAPERTASLRLLSVGGAGVTSSFVDRARHELGAVVKRAYGSTEAPTITTARFDDPQDRMVQTDGRAFDASEVRTDGTGEVLVRGPELARGYLDAVRTAESFVDGWFRTGDLGVIEDGWLTITGRLGDRIIRGGENIDAAEVEQHLEAHPAIRQAVALGEPDERLGERVVAYVVADDVFDLEMCRDWFSRRGATRFITPERIVRVDDFPLLASGKIDRAALRSMRS